MRADVDASRMDMERRFGGLLRLYGRAAAQRIWQAHVVVVGVGGVGSWAAEALVRSGVQTITLIDMDHVAESNINRQIHAVPSTLGQAKVDAMRDRLAHINPRCRIHVIDDFVTSENWPQILPVSMDGVIDACDQLSAKHAMACWALKNRRGTATGQGTPLVTVGAAGGKRLAHKVDVADLSAVTHDPLLAKLRYRLRREAGIPKAGKRSGLTCVYSAETVTGPHTDTCALADVAAEKALSDGTLNCHGYGSVVHVTATFGLAAVSALFEQFIKAGAAKRHGKAPADMKDG